MISATLRIRDHDFALEVLGVDFLAERDLRSLSVSRRGVRVADPLRLLADARSAIVSPSLLERLGLVEPVGGEPPVIRVRVGERDETLVVQGTLDPGGIAAAFGGQLALMDVYALQDLVGRHGWIDRIDVAIDPGAEVDVAAAELQARLHGFATVRRSSMRTREIDDVLNTLQLAVSMFSVVATVISALLTYAAMSSFSERQRRMLAALRATGMSARWATAGVITDTAIVSLGGTLLGSTAGLLLSAPMLGLFSTFTTGFRAEEIKQVSLQGSTLAIAGLVGILAALAGSVSPARRAARRYVLDALATDREGPARLPSFARPALGIAVVAALFAAPQMSVDPTTRLACRFLGTLGLVLLLAPLYPRVLRWLVRPLVGAAPSIGHLACAGFRAKPQSLAITLSVVGGIVGALTGIFLLVESLARTFENYAVTRYGDGVLITAGSLVDQSRRDLLTHETIELIRTTPGVEALAEQYWYRPTILFRGEEVGVWAASMDVIAARGSLPAIDRPGVELAQDVARGAVAVSGAFAKRFGVRSGDDIELDTPRGARTFRVAGILRDYMGARGSITFDIGTFDTYWQRPGAYQAVVWIGGPKERVLDDVHRRVSRTQDLFFAYGDELRRIQRERVLRFTGILEVIAAMVAALAGLAVTILLIGSVTQRRLELSLIRAAGAGPSQLIVLLLVDAVFVSLIASVLGTVLGYACTPLMVEIVEGAYGAPIERAWFAPQIPVAVLATVLVSILGATVPARIAQQTRPSDVLTFE